MVIKLKEPLSGKPTSYITSSKSIPSRFICMAWFQIHFICIYQRAKPCDDVRNSMDYKVSDNNKKINAIRHQRAEKIKKLELLQTQYDAMVREAAEALATDAGESIDAQVPIVILSLITAIFWMLG